MIKKNLLKKVSLTVLSVSVALSGMPAAAMAADFSDAEAAVVEEAPAEDTEEADAEAEATVEEETAEAAGETEKTAAADDFTSDDEFSDEAGEEEYKYVYAGLTWTEYWEAEGVAEATNTTHSTEQDSNGEYDKGAFDAITRATSRHGVHRGSFQTIASVFDISGKEYKLAGWKDQTTAILTDGTEVTLADGSVDGKEMDHYEVYGLKYVPVKVASADYDAFKAQYTVVENGGTLFGGYGEGTLSSFSYIADVNENTNGLKTAVKQADGTFTFSARQTGTGSGLKDIALRSAEADGAKVEVQEANGSYGEFLRADIKGENGEYAGLGASMQAVKWVYYGTDSTYTNAIATYGTKFASDNWFHKKNGIQLGLTHSIRCQLPEGTDGTGYWKVTVYGLGYQDYTFTFQATEANIVKDTGNADATALQAEVDKAKALNEADYTANSWLTLKGELDECEEMIANLQNYTQAAVDEQITHLTSAMSGLVKKEVKSVKLNASAKTVKVGKTTTLKATVDATVDYTVTWKSSKASVAAVDKNSGKVTAKAPGTATITATVTSKEAGTRTATCKVTVPNPVSVKGTTLYLKGTPAKATLKVTKSGVTGTAKFTSNNTRVVTVSSKGVVTAKKTGTATITVTVGKYKATCKVTVKNPSITVKASASTIKVGKTTTVKVTRNGVTGTAKFTSSNKNVATVSSKGVVKGKKAGTAKITVKVGKYTRTVTVKVTK